MAWVKKTDGAPWSKKIAPLSDGAYRLYDQSIHYCAREETDGTVLLSLIPVVIAGLKTKKVKECIAELVAARLWHMPGDDCDSPNCPANMRPTCEGTWDVHDYLEHNRTHAELEADRDAKLAQRRSAGRAGGLASGEARRKRTRSEVASPALGDSLHPQRSEIEPPSRPVPSVSSLQNPLPPEDPDYIEIGRAWEVLAGHTLSATDREEVRTQLVQLDRLPVAEIIGHLGDFMEWWSTQGIDRRPTFKNAISWLKDKNVKAADSGRRLALRGVAS